MEKLLLDNCKSSIISLDSQYNITYFNKAALENFSDYIEKGSTLENLFSKNYERLKEYLNAQNGETFRYIFDISDTFFKVTISKIENLYLLEIDDIKNEYLFNVINSINSGIVLCDPETLKLIYANKNFYEMTGYTKNELVGQNLALLKADESDRKERDILKEKLNEQKDVSVVLKNKSKDGSIFYNKVSITPIKNDYNNRLQFFLGTQSDVTLETAENKYFKAVLDSSKSIILVTNNGVLQKINQTFFDLFDYESVEDFKAQHKCICELFVKKGSTYLTEDMDGTPWFEYIKEKNSNETNKVCMIGKDGNEKVFQIDSSGKLFEDSDDELITFTDITILIKNKEMLEEQSKHAMMGEMIAMIAHQWRQPLATLNTIYAKINILNQMDKLTDEEFEKAYEKSIEIIQHLSQTIDDFRNFFHKIETTEVISISNLLKKAYNLLEPNFKTKNIELKVKYINHVEDLEIKINTSKMLQVLLNLLKNAYDELLKLEHKDKIITIICDVVDNNLFISILDNAGGIPKEIINSIFDPYFSTKSKNGTGLGLYMSKMIIEDHMGGSLNVKNQTKGANFIITIPLNKVGEKEDE